MLDELERAIASVDRLDWRIAQEPDGEWVAWFHPDWQSDPVRVVLADEEPSKNEVAAIAALQLMLAHAPRLVEMAGAVRNYRAMWKLADDALTQGSDPQTTDRLLGEENTAREHLFTLLRQLEEAGGTREG
jgi:hypothetical protein